jgi:CheY-like chemotaxis protein
LKILVVEDEKKVALALQKGLESEYYDVQVALTGEEGFYLLCSREFDLVVLDLRNQGHVVTREMLAREVWKETERAEGAEEPSIADMQSMAKTAKVTMAAALQKALKAAPGTALVAELEKVHVDAKTGLVINTEIEKLVSPAADHFLTRTPDSVESDRGGV